MVFLIVMIILILMIIFLGLKYGKSPKLKAKLVKTKKGLMWNGILRVVQIGYLGYAATFIHGIMTKDTLNSTNQFVHTIIFGAITISFVVFVFLLIYKSKEKI